MQIVQDFVQHEKSRSKGTNSRRYITIHETANAKKGADAFAHAKLQKNGFHTSWHWQVDDQVAVQSYPHSAICWHAGTSQGNAQSIAVEICVNEDGDYEKAVHNAIQLVRKLMQEENIPVRRVVQHHYWSGKDCPSYLKNGKKGVNWEKFIQALGEQRANEHSDLKIGAKGKQVKELQEQLNRLHYKIAIDCSFGTETAFAVRFFQAKYQLMIDGIYGPKTATLLRRVIENQPVPVAVIRYGAQGVMVEVLQTVLRKLGSNLQIDGAYGPLTRSAVEHYQRQQKLGIDGIVGPVTWHALKKSYYA